MMQILTLFPLAARTVDTTGPTLEIADGAQDLAVYVRVTALSSGASLTVTIEDSPDGVAWATLLSFSAITSVSTLALRATQLGRYVRARGQLAGTSPSVTYSVVAVGR